MSSNDQLMQELDATFSGGPAQTTGDILAFIQAHKAKALVEWGRYTKQFEDIFHELNEIIQLLNYVKKDHWKDHKKAQYVLYPETLKTLHRAFEDILDGYYDEALILLRSVYESFLRLVFASCYPQDYESIFVNTAGKRVFNVTNFLCDNLKLDWGFLYRILSVMSHAKKSRAMAKLMNPGIISLEYEYSQEGMAMGVNLSSFFLSCLFHACISVFGDDLPNDHRLKARIPRIQEIDRLQMEMTKANPKPGFSKLAGDLQKIGQIIRVADRGDDWAKLL